MTFYDLAYWAGLGAASPVWLARSKSRRKVLAALRERMGRVPAIEPAARVVMIHAVSVGEMNATRALVDELRKRLPDTRFVVSVTTTTGHERGLALYGEVADVMLVRYPLDFSRAVRRALDALHPALVILMELEVWPNFLAECRRRAIPVMIANGRITEPSYGKYKWVSPVTRRMFRSLAHACVQDQTVAMRFLDLGLPPDRVQITGTMKFDTAAVAAGVPGDGNLAWYVGLSPGEELIWVCGSTGPGEEAIILRAYRELLLSRGRMRLVIVPRHPERFDEVAETIRAARFETVRRSQPGRPGPNADAIPPVVLGDTMGELRKFYSLADVVFVGRTLVDLGARQHGSDMIEPAALGKATLVGPFTGNFAEVMRAFRQSEAIFEVARPEQLGQAVNVLLSTPAERAAMGARAREVVLRGKGSTALQADAAVRLMHV